MTEAKVTRIVDGDTIEVEIGGFVFGLRYIGIDCPEPVQPHGDQATEANRQLVEGKTVLLEKDVSDVDGERRLLRYVHVGEIFVNAELVRLGYATASTYPPDVRYSDLFAQLAMEAKEAGRGLWAAPTPSSESG
jgi:micrococcal nuclease